MAGGKTLNAWVVLGGKVDSSFTQLGNNLVMLGSSIDGISQKLINFGKESVNTYRNYEDSMLDAQVAMATTYGQGTRELNAVMSQLDRQASEWAATTIFHTDDVAAAIAEAAHANWDLDKILTGMPAAMRLAQAGGLDLATGLDYIIKSTNAAKISFSDLENWVDEWTYSANSSAGTVEEFGEAMLKMGATMRFADNKEELLAMLATLHDAGTTGSNAGTLLRNSMIRLVAPTKKASDAMEELGVAQSDIDEALSETNGDLTKVTKLLGDAGFSAYKSNGELKDFATIFEDLNAATKFMSDDDRFEVWSAIFPTRSITGAMALIEAADKKWNGLLDDLNGGKANGYGQYAADTMMSGLTGSLETFNSKVEDLRKELGQQLAPQLTNVVENFGKVIDLLRAGGQDNGVSSGLDWLSSVSDLVGNLAENMEGMDPAVFDALVAGLGGIAALGPTLLTAGIGIRTIGWGMSVFTGTTLGKIILAAAAIGIIATALNKYHEARYKSNFGDLTIDTTGLDQNMQSLKEAFEIATAPTEQFAKALDDCVTNYNTASTTLSSTMMEDLLKDQTLTGDELDKKLGEYRTLGSQMVGALKEGITNSADMSAEFWAKLFKGQKGADEDLAKNEIFAGIIKALDEEKGEAIQRAEAIGNALQAAINKAWEDGHLDPDEYDNIKNYFKELNKAMAEAEREAQNEQDYVKRRAMMDKMQGMSYNQMMDYINTTIAPQRQEELDWYEGYFNSNKYSLEYNRDKLVAKQKAAKESGDLELAEHYQEQIDNYNNLIAGADEAYRKNEAEIYSNYDDILMTWFTATGTDSELGTQNLIQAAKWLMGGQVTDLDELKDYAQSKGTKISDSARYYGELVDLLGGVDAMTERLNMYRENGDTAMANQMEQVLAIYSILMGGNEGNMWEGPTWEGHELSARELEGLYKSGLMHDIQDYFNILANEGIDETQKWTEKAGLLETGYGGYIKEMREAFGELYDMDMVNALLGGDIKHPEIRSDYALMNLLDLSSSDRNLFAKGGEYSNLYNAANRYMEAQGAYEAAYNNLQQPDGSLAGTEAQLTELQSLKTEADNSAAELKNAADAAGMTDDAFNQFILMLDMGGSKAETFGDKVKGAGMTLDDAASSFGAVGAGLDGVTGSAAQRLRPE